jgi:hypothetical protein
MRGYRFIDRTGDRIGYITITKLSDKVYVNPCDNKKVLKWEYKCDCGETGNFNSTDYNKRKNSKLKTSCGCNIGGYRDTLLLNESGFNTCFDCKQTLPICKFGKNSSSKNGLQRGCKSCKSKRDSKYRNDPRFRQQILDNKMKDYWKIRNNPDLWVDYLEKNRQTRDYVLEYQQIQTNPLRKSKDAIRKLLLSSFKIRNIKKSKLCMKSEEILGCSFQQFKDHIESQFTNGMHWLNHGEWHLDHKVPLALANNVAELIKLNHWTNFQPLWSGDNLSKGDVLLNEHLDLYKKLLG